MFQLPVVCWGSVGIAWYTVWELERCHEAERMIDARSLQTWRLNSVCGFICTPLPDWIMYREETEECFYKKVKVNRFFDIFTCLSSLKR